MTMQARENNIVLNPKQQRARKLQQKAPKLLVEQSSLYFYHFHRQAELDGWLQANPDKKLSTAYSEIKRILDNPDCKFRSTLSNLLSTMRYAKDEDAHKEIETFLSTNIEGVDFIIKNEKSSVIKQFVTGQQDVKFILKRTIAFYINFAFFYAEFASWASSKQNQTDFQSEYAQMMKEFWECIPKEDYDKFANALLANRGKDEKKITQTLNELIKAHPKIAPFLKKYDNSCVINTYFQELNDDSAQLDQLIQHAIERYQAEKITKSPSPTTLRKQKTLGIPLSTSKTHSFLEGNFPKLIKSTHGRIWFPKPVNPTNGRVFTIFSHGTCSEKNDYTNSMYGKMGEAVSTFGHIMDSNNPGTEYIDFIRIDGPGSGNKRHGEFLRYAKEYSATSGILFGYGMAENVQQALDCMKYQAEPEHPKEKTVAAKIQLAKSLTKEGKLAKITCVNIVGWSRGAVVSIEIANKMADDKDLKDIEINLFLFDPVPGYANASATNRLLTNPKINFHYLISQQDERSAGFAALIPRVDKSNTTTKNLMSSLPGGHGTAVGNPYYRNPDAQRRGVKVKKPDTVMPW